jgi:hypothetical protein
MDKAKPWYASKTIWASLVAVFAALATGFGHPIDAKMQADVVDITIKVVGLGASVLAIFGRLKAISRIA